jgi:hypothetical protein
LRINDDHGSFYLNDAASLQSRFQEVFPPAVRAVILAERSQSISCSFRGVMYGTGTVWVNPTKLSYAIWAINLPQVRESARPSIDKIVFPCETDKQRLVIDIEASGAPRLRAWNKPRSVTDEPDIQISKGTERFEGTGPCVRASGHSRAGQRSSLRQNWAAIRIRTHRLRVRRARWI